MIDTINFFIPKQLVPENWFVNAVFITNRRYVYSNTRVSNYGQFANFRITQTDEGIYVYGSLAKYYLGTNQKTLLQSDLVPAVEKLSKETTFLFLRQRYTGLILQKTLLLHNLCPYIINFGGMIDI